MIDWSAVESFGGLVFVIGMGVFFFTRKDTFDFRTGLTTPASVKRLIGLRIAGVGILFVLLGFILK